MGEVVWPHPPKAKRQGLLGHWSNVEALSREVTSGAKSRQFRSEWTPLGVHVCLDE
jgi:hypothetical protein